MHMNEPAVPLKIQHGQCFPQSIRLKRILKKKQELSNLLEEITSKTSTKEIDRLLGSKAKEYREFLRKAGKL